MTTATTMTLSTVMGTVMDTSTEAPGIVRLHHRRLRPRRMSMALTRMGTVRRRLLLRLRGAGGRITSTGGTSITTTILRTGITGTRTRRTSTSRTRRRR
ncbi:hypothetical protein [Hyalangium versicolor]|uniref:hypothetical protein n=1 Tax=Hyalangium versicolor TaxID=2861190 RepID=UPI001CC9BF3E|nr:hypothetical protein [Hyalangium versicolor]